jgi:hypothetical protein
MDKVTDAQDRRRARAYADAPRHWPVDVVDGSAPPRRRGSPGHWTTPTGRPVYHPSSYGYRTVYHVTTERVEVGAHWFRRVARLDLDQLRAAGHRHRERAKARRVRPTPPLAERLEAHVRSRHGVPSAAELRDRDGRGLWLFAPPRRGRRSGGPTLLVGRDSQDGVPFAASVPGDLWTVEQALRWLVPAAVYAAQRAGVPVIRQGDAWAIRSARDRYVCRLPWRHTWDPETRTLMHPEHAPVVVPWPATFCAGRRLRGSFGD